MPPHRDDPKSVGRYKLVDRLGAGGMGVVYRGRARSGRDVAVKVVRAPYVADPVFRTRFRQEIEAVRRVVAVSPGQRHTQRGAVRVGQHVMLRARPCTVNRARADFDPRTDSAAQ